MPSIARVNKPSMTHRATPRTYPLNAFFHPKNMLEIHAGRIISPRKTKPPTSLPGAMAVGHKL